MSNLEAREPEAQDIIYQRAGINWMLLVRATPDRLGAFMDLEPLGEGGPIPQAPEIVEALRPAGLTLPADLTDRLAAALRPEEGLAVMTRVRGLPLTEGTPPTAGKPAEVRWLIEWERAKAAPVADEQVDFHDTGHIVQVKEGDAILEILPPTRGQDGLDILGQPIPGRMGENPPLVFGDHVAYDETTRILRATLAGEVRHEENKVWVDQVYRVENDVDFNVGNVDFEGDVSVGGSVQDGFVVRAKRDIKVAGSVMAATLEAGGNITIGEGATGHEKGVLTAPGNLQAKYLNGVKVTVGGNLRVTNEVLNCTIKVGGRAIIERGSVVGGELVVLRGLETRALGAQMTVPTVVRVGVDPETDARRQAIFDRLKTINKHIERIYLNIKPFVENPQRVAQLPASRRDVVKQFLIEMAGLKAERDTHERDLKELQARPVDPADLYVKVTKIIHGKVEIHIGTCTQRYDAEVYGPLRLVPDESTGRLKAG
jgi:uncharacterized protein (DUF342 family)